MGQTAIFAARRGLWRIDSHGSEKGVCPYFPQCRWRKSRHDCRLSRPGSGTDAKATRVRATSAGDLPGRNSRSLTRCGFGMTVLVVIVRGREVELDGRRSLECAAEGRHTRRLDLLACGQSGHDRHSCIRAGLGTLEVEENEVPLAHARDDTLRGCGKMGQTAIFAARRGPWRIDSHGSEKGVCPYFPHGKTSGCCWRKSRHDCRLSRPGSGTDAKIMRVGGTPLQPLSVGQETAGPSPDAGSG